VPPRKERLTVVLDTNVILGFYLSRSAHSANARVFRLWRDQRTLQLVVCDALVSEYLEVLQRLQVAERKLQRFAQRLRQRETVSHVRLGPRFNLSRDPDDNLLFATAIAGKVRFLVTNDRDLLDIPDILRGKFVFQIVKPQELLAQLGA
jgi:putative PIN family toxin of toxin-antitoxin system